MVHMDHLKVHLGAHIGHFVAHMGNLGICIRMSTVILGNQIIMAMHFAFFNCIIRKFYLYWNTGRLSKTIPVLLAHLCCIVLFSFSHQIAPDSTRMVLDDFSVPQYPREAYWGLREAYWGLRDTNWVLREAFWGLR